MTDIIKPVVRSNFLRFNTKFEGVIPFCYLDCKGLVTIGVGNLIDPVSLAKPLPFLHLNGNPASIDEIVEEWTRIKNNHELAQKGAGAAKGFCSLRLDEAGISNLVDDKLTQMVDMLAKRFPISTWPADAQLAVCSMSWAMGPGFHFPKFEMAVTQGDFWTASTECAINATGNPGVVPRNAANKMLLENAAKVIDQGLNGDELHLEALPDNEVQGATDVDPNPPVAS